MTGAAALIQQAATVLRGNDVGGYTKPSPRLYPHQWNWDSAFIAIGWAHLDWVRAVREIETLLSGQWTNGMLPHIRYNPQVTDYAPGPEWWGAVPVRDAAQITSGISQPPVLASAVYTAGLLQPDLRRRLTWWAQVFEPVRESLLYFARHRTVGESPLIAIVHPWESGLDNSPRWDFVVGQGYKPSRPYRRVDTTVVDASARPTTRDYDLYMHLVELIAAHRYDLRAFFNSTPFVVYDALFNAAWYRSAADLNRMAGALGRPPAFEEATLGRFKDSYHRTLWDPSAAMFRDYDVRGQRPIPVDTVAGLMAIYGGLVDPAGAKTMLSRYRDRSAGCVLLPSTPPDQAGFDPVKYWRGPAWVNMNWMLIQGLRSLELQAEASELRAATLDLVSRTGCSEYYHAYTGEALGGRDFSWTAALLIDLLREQQPA
ncbi:MAG TPA: trehalase family glycosidase [bacterium]|nr:trehalase family glycosidase [bacterium]